jgi:hypothetical protein
VTERKTVKRVNYRLPDTGKTVPAFVLCTTGEATLLFVPSFGGQRPDSIVIAHDDDLDGVFEDMEVNWFNVEPKDLRSIADHLRLLGSKLR